MIFRAMAPLVTNKLLLKFCRDLKLMERHRLLRMVCITNTLRIELQQFPVPAADALGLYIDDAFDA